MKRQLASYGLLVALLLPIVMVWGSFELKRKTIRKEAKHQIISDIEKSALTQLTFSSAQLHQLKWEHSTEFEYKGELYDVVETHQHGDSITYICWWDNEETKLNQQRNQLAALLFQQDPQNQKQQTQLVQFFKNLFQKGADGPPQSTETQLSKSPFSYQEKLDTRYLTLDTPPPKLG